jgi:hypothetical protein
MMAATCAVRLHVASMFPLFLCLDFNIAVLNRRLRNKMFKNEK